MFSAVVKRTRRWVMSRPCISNHAQQVGWWAINCSPLAWFAEDNRHIHSLERQLLFSQIAFTCAHTRVASVDLKGEEKNLIDGVFYSCRWCIIHSDTRAKTRKQEAIRIDIPNKTIFVKVNVNCTNKCLLHAHCHSLWPLPLLMRWPTDERRARHSHMCLLFLSGRMER